MRAPIPSFLGASGPEYGACKRHFSPGRPRERRNRSIESKINAILPGHEAELGQYWALICALDGHFLVENGDLAHFFYATGDRLIFYVRAGFPANAQSTLRVGLWVTLYAAHAHKTQ